MPPFLPTADSSEDYYSKDGTVTPDVPSVFGSRTSVVILKKVAEREEKQVEDPEVRDEADYIAENVEEVAQLADPATMVLREEMEGGEQLVEETEEQYDEAELTGQDVEEGVEESGQEEVEPANDGDGDGDDEEDDEESAADIAAQDGDASGEDEDAESEEEEAEFEAAESGSEESEVAAESKNCMYCNQSEDDDPSEEFEQYLNCTSCGRYSHGQCARENNVSREDGDVEGWMCADCSQNQTTPESIRDNTRQRSSAPRLVRDLLPVSRGMQKPDSHSIFAQPLMSDRDEDGRRLRKRAATSELAPLSEKRRRKATPRAAEGQTPTNTITMESRAMETAIAHATRRASNRPVPLVRIIQQRPFNKPPPHKFILAFHLEQAKIEAILSKPPKPGRKRDRRKPPKIPPPPIFQAPIPKFPALPAGHLIFPSVFSDKETDLNNKPYGGILSEADGDTTRSLPQLKDREIFEIARKEAEEERRRTSEAAEAQLGGDTAAAASKRTVSGPPSKIKCIQFGKHVIDTFYAAPYPEEYSHESRLFICEFCLKYLPSEFVAYRHKLKCPAKHPPGDEIYRDGSISIWEVDGRKKTEYCQCLCLMAKMFLGSKTLYYDVEPFLFYILTEYDEFGYHFVGYFSKEKRPASLNNVSCILVMPIHQRKGYAMYLIDFSYLLTRIEGKEGSPEKPLSDMGLTAYRSYWDLTMSRHLLILGLRPFSTKELMARTGMTADDVIHTLERLYAFVKDPVTKTYAIRFDRKLYENIVQGYDAKKHRGVKPEMLVWTPYVMGRSDAAALDGNPMQTVAQREGDSEDEEDEQNETEQPSINGANGGAGSDVEMEDAAASKTERSRSRSQKAASHHSSALVNGDGIAEDEDARAPTNANGQIAPGPPSTTGIDAAVSTEFAEATSTLTEQVNGARSPTKDKAASEQPSKLPQEDELTGYALAFRTHSIPPQRFQIDPPIPPSMLRNNRSVKRKGFARQRSGLAINGDGTETPVMSAAVRSSPRRVGSGNEPGTPMRRSGRRSGLVNEVGAMGLDGAGDSVGSAGGNGSVKTPRKEVLDLGLEEEGAGSEEEEEEAEGSGEEEEEGSGEEESSDDEDAEVVVGGEEEESGEEESEEEEEEEEEEDVAVEVRELGEEDDGEEDDEEEDDEEDE
jgi:histone acetyltransferase SAS3